MDNKVKRRFTKNLLKLRISYDKLSIATLDATESLQEFGKAFEILSLRDPMAFIDYDAILDRQSMN